jgi:hypothetical protein
VIRSIGDLIGASVDAKAKASEYTANASVIAKLATIAYIPASTKREPVVSLFGSDLSVSLFLC